MTAIPTTITILTTATLISDGDLNRNDGNLNHKDGDLDHSNGDLDDNNSVDNYGDHVDVNDGNHVFFYRGNGVACSAWTSTYFAEVQIMSPYIF